MEDLRQPQFNKILDSYLMTGSMNTDDYEVMTRPQKIVIQTIKRAFNRIKR